MSQAVMAFICNMVDFQRVVSPICSFLMVIVFRSMVLEVLKTYPLLAQAVLLLA